jgi:hypothetical protein
LGVGSSMTAAGRIAAGCTDIDRKASMSGIRRGAKSCYGGSLYAHCPNVPRSIVESASMHFHGV